MPAAAATQSSVTVGEIRLTFLPDGIIHMAPESLTGGPAAQQVIADRYADETGRLVLSLGSLLIETANRRLLVDLAVGDTTVVTGHSARGPSDMIGGALLRSLGAVGLQPADIDAVVYSHLHPDHVGWACAGEDRTPVFANATHYVGAAEWAYWTVQEAGNPIGPTAEQRAAIESRLELVHDGFSPAPGVTVLLTPGHTPGHCSLVVSTGLDRAVVLGDMVHCPLEITTAEVEFIYDVDPALARRTKELVAKELEVRGTIAVGGHFPDAVFGRLLQGTGAPEFHALAGS